MRLLILYLTASLIMLLMACSKSGEPTEEWEPVLFEELSDDERPPCLYYWGSGMEIVITSDDDYETIRRIYAPQGQYVDFEANGIQRSFKLQYQPLDTNNDGVIRPNDLIIYVKNKPLYANVNGELISVSANPIRMAGDSIMIFRTSPPYTVERMIYYKEVFTVDQVTGEVTFNMPPQKGSKVSLCATRRLYDTYHDRECSMQYFDFTSRIIIGKAISGNGCLKGFEKELFMDNVERRLIYLWRRIEDDTQGGCPEILLHYDSWITVDRSPDDYEVVFILDYTP